MEVLAMKYRFPLVLVLLPQLTIASLAQQPTPSPATQPLPKQEPATQHQQQEDVVRISTNLVQVDAVVTDARGRVVTDLKPEEVQISEDGKPQKISNFSYVNAVPDTPSPTALATSSPATGKTAPMAPPTRIRPDQVRRTIAIVVDDLGLSFVSTYYVREALKKFVNQQVQPGDLVAIIRTGGGMGALQQFTSDKRLLSAAVEHVKWNSMGRGGIRGVAPLGGNTTNANAITQRPTTEYVYGGATAQGTLDALTYVIRGMDHLPGRKSLLLVSDGISAEDIHIPADDPIVRGMNYIVDLANRSSVVIYTMHAPGLQALTLEAADDVAGMRPNEISARLNSRVDAFFGKQESLRYLAYATGGIPIQNNNDLSEGVKRVLDDQKGYYLIGYRPDESTFDAKGRRKFHKLGLKVLRPGKFKVRIRSGFSAIDEEETQPAITRDQKLIAALTSPFGSAGVRLRMTALYANDPKLGSIMRSLMHIDARDLTFTAEEDGWHKAVFSVLAVTFGDNGTLVDEVGHTHTVRVRGASYQNLLKRGLVYVITLPVKKPGAYQLRLALRDDGSSRVGSASEFVAVPDLKKDQLTLSGILVSSPDEAASVSDDAHASGGTVKAIREIVPTDPAATAAVRQFQSGRSIGYGYFIYNPQLSRTNGRPELVTQIRLFRDGELVFTGKEVPYNAAGQSDLKRLVASASLKLGTELPPGEYSLQVIVTDLLAKAKYRTATQWTDFEIVK